MFNNESNHVIKQQKQLYRLFQARTRSASRLQGRRIKDNMSETWVGLGRREHPAERCYIRKMSKVSGVIWTHTERVRVH